MRTRQLGLQPVTAVGGGDLSLPTSAARGVAAGDVERALHEAISFGITLFDVAADTDSERLAGTAIRELRARDRVVVATRVALLAERAGVARRDQLAERLPPAYVQSAVEASLRATRLEALPLAQLPLRAAWRASSAWAELAGTCARLVHEGKVLAWGALLEPAPEEPEEPEEPSPPRASGLIVSGADLFAAVRELDLRMPDKAAGDLGAATAGLIAEPWLVSLSVVYNLCDRRAEPLFAAAAKREPPLAILARQPLAGAALAGKLGPGVHLPPRDERHELDDAALTRIAVEVARLSALVKHAPPAATSCEVAREAAERAERPEQVECSDVAELALRFAIDRAGIALPRLHRREHLMPAIFAASAPPLPAEIVSRALGDAASIH